MNASRIDTIARFLAERRSRRALARAGAGLAAGALAAGGVTATARAQNVTPAATDQDGPTLLFLQAFQAGSITASEAEGRYILMLEQGLGYTVYFSDRPDRVVGATPTTRFLAELGFPDDNPPNAALVVETAEGQTEVVVLELFAPAYDIASRTAIYQVEVLGEWERATDGTVSETTVDPAEVLGSFGAAHLFIDSLRNAGTPNCDQSTVYCYNSCTAPPYGDLGTGNLCWSETDQACMPCQPADLDAECTARFPDHCAGNCFASTSFGAMCG
jgi:hypothetical protein